MTPAIASGGADQDAHFAGHRFGGVVDIHRHAVHGGDVMLAGLADDPLPDAGERRAVGDLPVTAFQAADHGEWSLKLQIVVPRMPRDSLSRKAGAISAGLGGVKVSNGTKL